MLIPILFIIQGPSQAVSYLLVTTSMGDEAVDVRKYLRRTVPTLPPLLTQLADRALEAADHSKAAPLCQFLKAFGKCRYVLHYMSRIRVHGVHVHLPK